MLIFAPLRKPVLKWLTAWIEKQDVLVNIHELANFDLVIIGYYKLNYIKIVITDLKNNDFS